MKVFLSVEDIPSFIPSINNSVTLFILTVPTRFLEPFLMPRYSKDVFKFQSKYIYTTTMERFRHV